MALFKWIGMFLGLLPLAAGSTWYAPDLKEGAGTTVFLGLVNPTESDHVVTLTGYNAAGAELGTVSLSIAAYEKKEIQAQSLFTTGSVAWARIEAPDASVGYLRYEGPNEAWISITGLSHTSGADVWVPQVNETLAGAKPRTVLVNTSNATGSAVSQPTPALDALDRESLENLSQVIPGFNAGYQQESFDYSGTYAKVNELSWDRIRAEGLQLTGLQHLEHSQGVFGDTLPLTRTPYRRMIASPQQPLRSGWNRMVLINTNTTQLRVEITPHYAWYGTPPNDFTYQHASTVLFLEAGERRVVDLARPTQLEIPAKADWFDIRPFEGGLIGYQLFGTNDGKAIGVVDISHEPGSNRVLPHVLENSRYETRISVVNTDESEGESQVWGYAANGALIERIRTGRLRAYEKQAWTLTQLFGSKASQVAWVLVKCSNGQLAAHATVGRRDGSALAGLKAVPLAATTSETLFSASMEQFVRADLEGQGWNAVAFTHAGERYHENDIDSDSGDQVKPGQFFVEHNFNGADGNFYLGYEPFNSGSTEAEANGHFERVALVAPPVEIPLYGAWHLSYRIRFHNPLSATKHSKFGLIWRVEGDANWNWFGLTGWHLLRPDNVVGDCWVDIQWRNQVATITPWVPFEITLPPETAGKRIELAYFYDYRPGDESELAPWMFLDQIEIKANPTPFALLYEQFGQGVLTPEDMALEVDPPVPSVGEVHPP